MDSARYLADLERIPDTLAALADALDDGLLPLEVPAHDRVLLLGMGSSAYVAGVVAARLRHAGVDAVAELASSDLLPPPDPRTLVLAVSASGRSAETLAATAPHAGVAPVVAVTEDPAGPLADLATGVLPLLAGPEDGGVACRSYRHALAVLLALAERLSPGVAPALTAGCRTAAAATAHLLDTRDGWLPEVADRLDGPQGSWVVAPARRLASAQQSALMLREGPRRPSHACETGDWSHVDVYLTKTLDYRMLLLTGSAYQPELMRWVTERGSTVVAVGADVEGAAAAVRYPGDDVDDVRLLTETTVAELLAARWWAAS